MKSVVKNVYRYAWVLIDIAIITVAYTLVSYFLHDLYGNVANVLSIKLGRTVFIAAALYCAKPVFIWRI